MPPRHPGDGLESSGTSTQATKAQKVLACANCQQRKVKCDRKSPCANCVKSGTPCVSAALAPRRRRFPERALLERLRKYEGLLREHDIHFEPLHPTENTGGSSNVGGRYYSDEDEERQTRASVAQPPAASATTGRTGLDWPKDIWKALYHEHDSHEYDSDSSYGQVRETTVQKAWDVLFNNNNHLILGLRKSLVDLSTLHPEPIHIFRLWQVYLDNVDPLLKITHNSRLQSRIIEAAGNLTEIEPCLEALMFSINCISVLSLSDEDCQSMFNSFKKDMLAKNHIACQEALINCGYMRTGDRDCLTALYLYLVSAGQGADPRSLSPMLGAAIRIGQRMGIHSEAANSKCTPHEAEMRRRLWWSLVLFDARISEMAHFKITTLTPDWDCKAPLNIGDAGLRPDLREPPPSQVHPTEAIFPVVRGEIAEWIRHTLFFLDLTCPALKPLVKNRQQAPSEPNELAALESMLENKYLSFCDLGNPLQFMTVWTARGFIAKYQLIQYYTKCSTSSYHQTEADRNAAISYALRVLDCDTKLMTSRLTKGYTWLTSFYFPLPAYMHLVQELKRRPFYEEADRVWEIMSDNQAARFNVWISGDNPLFKLFFDMIMEAWEARESASRQTGESLTTPRIVTQLREILTHTGENEQDNGAAQTGDAVQSTSLAPVTTFHDISMPTPPTLGNPSLMSAGQWPSVHTNIPGSIPFNPLWASMSWGLGGERGC
ncbi:hypothetical protein F5Y19DRAFT_468806 [Xylariaceae sp. FL1651]|nr:hypothetical protein F5Y19DRAFT_468806 [Xylariaceae sp. FL1651]